LLVCVVADLLCAVRQGELSTWAKLSAIHCNCGIEATLDACIQQVGLGRGCGCWGLAAVAAACWHLAPVGRLSLSLLPWPQRSLCAGPGLLGAGCAPSGL
jgi:hypothetical protein